MKGFTSLEVSLSLMLISMSLTLFLQQQIKARFQMAEIFHKTTALYQALALKERLNSNEKAEFQHRELAIWKSEIEESLPHGNGDLHQSSTFYDILVTWKDRELNQLRLKLPK